MTNGSTPRIALTVPDWPEGTYCTDASIPITFCTGCGKGIYRKAIISKGTGRDRWGRKPADIPAYLRCPKCAMREWQR